MGLVAACSQGARAQSLAAHVEELVQRDALVQAADAAVLRARADALRVRLLHVARARLDVHAAAVPRTTGDAVDGAVDWSRWGPSVQLDTELAVAATGFGLFFALRHAADAAVDSARWHAQRVRAERAAALMRAALGVAEARCRRHAAGEAGAVLDAVGAILDERDEADDPTFDPTDLLRLRVSRARVATAAEAAEADLGAARMRWVAATSGSHERGKAPHVPALTAWPQPPASCQTRALRQWLRQHDPGLRAARALRRAAEAMNRANWMQWAPVVGVAGRFGAGWAPLADDQRGPFARDPYNRLTGGAAPGLLWALHPAARVAATRQARADEIRAGALVEGTVLEGDVALTDALARLRRDGAAARAWRRAVEAARDQVDLARKRFERDAGAHKVLEAVGQWLEARSESCRARAGQLSDWFDVLETIGVPAWNDHRVRKACVQLEAPPARVQ